MTQSLKAVEIELNGTRLIEASAGTGKTYTIEELYVRLLVEKELDVENILVVTFTHAATSELRDRIRRRLLQARKIFEEEKCEEENAKGFYTTLLKRVVPGKARDRIDRALRSFDLAAISTIHGFCARILSENAFESGSVFESDVEADIQPVVEEVVNDFWVRNVYGANELFVSYLRQKGIGPGTLTKLAKKIHAWVEADILPAGEPSAPDLSNWSDWEQAYDDCKKIWADAGPVILNELQECADQKILNGRKYPALKIPERCARLDDWFALEKPLPTSLPEKFDNFTSTMLASSVNKAAEKKGLSCPSHPFFEACDRLATETVKLLEILDAQVLDLKLEFADEIRSELPKRMKQKNLRGYDDILRDLDNALQSQSHGKKLTEAICGIYRAALIDEFQDTDRVQYRIFQKIHAASNLPIFFIGDPKQAIYSFRGADIFTYLEAKEDAGNNLYALDTNWRSDPMLVDAVNKLFLSRENPFRIEEIPYQEVTWPKDKKNNLVIESKEASGLEITWFNEEEAVSSTKAGISKAYADKKICNHLCNSISSLLDGKCQIEKNPVQPRNVAVLVRNNIQGQKIQQALREVNIPSVVNGGGNIFKTPEIYELYLWLTAVTDPSKDGRLRAALSTSLLGLDASEIAGLGLESNESTRDHWINRFHDWNELWSSNGFISLFRDFMESKENEASEAASVQARILSHPDGERCLTNLLHAAELIHAEGTSRKLGPAQLMGWIESRLTSEDAESEAEELRMESDAEAVQIVTIHSSKGLEYPIVFCPYTGYGGYLRAGDKKALVYHDTDENNKLKLNISPLKDTPEEARAEEEILQEDLRLFYVALTRAKNLCTISWGPFGYRQSAKFVNSPLYWLLEPGSEESSALRDAAEKLCSKSKGTIRQNDANDGNPVPRPREEITDSLSCRETTRDLSDYWSTSSYSRLTKKKHYVPPHLSEGQDHDDKDAESPGQDDHEATLKEPILLEGFGGGVVAGNCFHAIYEDLDFTESDPTHLENLARKHLDKYGLDSDTWLDKVCETVRETLQAPLDPKVKGLELSAIDAKNRLNEMEFLFPLSQDREGRSHGKPLDTNRLAEAFASSQAGAIPPEYPDKIKTLGFKSLRGFLTGSIDLAFQFKGRWYIADYKSNSLGNKLGDYSAGKTAETMMSHHYILQYHIYTVALHRYLQARLPGYNYEDHFGGIYYLFIKGMKKSLGPANGIFMDRPALELINKLDETFKGGVS